MLIYDFVKIFTVQTADIFRINSVVLFKIASTTSVSLWNFFRHTAKKLISTLLTAKFGDIF